MSNKEKCVVKGFVSESDKYRERILFGITQDLMNNYYRLSDTVLPNEIETIKPLAGKLKEAVDGLIELSKVKGWYFLQREEDENP